MSTYLTEEMIEGLARARRQAQSSKRRLRVMAGEKVYPVLRLWDKGFSLDRSDAEHLRGLVDIFDGAKHLSQCLIVCSAEDGDEIVYEFKRNTAASEGPARDFAVDEDSPIALLR